MIITMLHIVSAATGITFALIQVLKLTMFPDSFKFVERFGMGLAGGAQILRLGPILSQPMSTPFDDWATTIMQIGILLMAAGRFNRLLRHSRNNSRAIDAAEAHLRARGRI